MKFQLVTLIAALSLIAPVLASPAPAPHYDDKPAYCDPHKKIYCPWGYVCCHHKCYKGDKCPKKDHKDDHKKDDHKKDDHKDDKKY